MKKWQKSSLILLSFSFAMGWIAQGEATLIRLSGPNVTISQPQLIQVIVVDSHGSAFEQTAYYDPSAGGIDLDTSWAGPNASIYIPSLGLGYVWYNGYWVDEEGYYWDGGRRVYLAVPEWREHWHHYWDLHRRNHGFYHGDRGEKWRERWHDTGEKWHNKVEGWKDRGKEWLNRGREGHDRMHDRGQNWDSHSSTSENIRSDTFHNERPSGGQSSSFDNRRFEDMRLDESQSGKFNQGMGSHGFQGGQSEKAFPSSGLPSGQFGGERMGSHGFQGGQSERGGASSGSPSGQAGGGMGSHGFQGGQSAGGMGERHGGK